jgi:hypothetical protein
MNFELNNERLGTWLTVLNNRTIEEVYQVDFIEDRINDGYLPWILILTFRDFDKYVEIEGDFDGDHIKISMADIAGLKRRIEENIEPNLWTAYKLDGQESFGKIIGQNVRGIEYGIDKEEFEINGTTTKGQRDLFTFIRFHFTDLFITVFEGGTGLFITNDSNVKLNFEETFDKYDTR